MHYVMYTPYKPKVKSFKGSCKAVFNSHLIDVLNKTPNYFDSLAVSQPLSFAPLQAHTHTRITAICSAHGSLTIEI